MGFEKPRAEPVSLVSSFPRAHGNTVPLQWAPRISPAFREEPLPRPLLCIWQGCTAPHTRKPWEGARACRHVSDSAGAAGCVGRLSSQIQCSLRAVFPSKQCVISMISPLCKTKDLKLRQDGRAAQSKGQSQALNLPLSDSQGRPGCDFLGEACRQFSVRRAPRWSTGCHLPEDFLNRNGPFESVPAGGRGHSL